MEKINYDKEEDILNIQLRRGDYWKSIELDNGVVVDIDKEGRMNSIEFLGAKKIFTGENKKVIERLV